MKSFVIINAVQCRKKVNSMEDWKDIIGYEGLYQVSNMGNVKSLPRLTRALNGAIMPFKGKSLIPQIDKGGYCRVSLRKNSIAILHSVHRLVAMHFLQNPYNFDEVNHKNGIKTDNRATELEWCNRSYNKTHSYRVLGQKKMNGVNSGMAKVTPSDIANMKIDYQTMKSYSKVGTKYNISGTQAWRILTKKAWQHL